MGGDRVGKTGNVWQMDEDPSATEAKRVGRVVLVCRSMRVS